MSKHETHRTYFDLESEELTFTEVELQNGFRMSRRISAEEFFRLFDLSINLDTLTYTFKKVVA